MTELEKLAVMFSTLGDETRLKIVLFLQGKQASVTEITNQMDISQSAVSHQLRLLKSTGILTSYKKGKNVFYSLNDDHVKNIIEIAVEHVNH